MISPDMIVAVVSVVLESIDFESIRGGSLQRRSAKIVIFFFFFYNHEIETLPVASLAFSKTVKTKPPTLLHCQIRM